MTKDVRATSYVRIITLLAGLLLPSLVLLPFGTIWLWQHGYLLHWAVAAALLVGLAFAAQWRLLAGAPPETITEPAEAANVDAAWTPAEQRAWDDVLAQARNVDVSTLTSREAILALGTDTVRIVAQRLHPEVQDPLWQFTVPEALALVERVSRRLAVFTVENVPLSDRFTVAQAMSLYEWRGAISIAEKAFDVWRLIRMANPLTAATHELRERLSKQMLQWGRDHVAQRLAYAYVSEVGRAAIDLYGGRLRVSAAELTSSVSPVSTADSATIAGRLAEPLRVLIVGQIGAGKSSLVNALASQIHAEVDALPATADYTPYQLRRADFPGALLIDSPGLSGSDEDFRALLRHVDTCDLVLWVSAAHRADRDIERTALERVRASFQSQHHRRPPPMLLVLTHIDHLRPLLEWSPPYDLQSAAQPKAVSIRTVVDEVSQELGFHADDVVPVSLKSPSPYNVDALWARILMVLPEAQRAQLVRRLQDARTSWNWQRVWTQAIGAGRVLHRTLSGREPRQK